jgi:dipeptidyl aminopeptidase/acylaminoacyl peptidase
MSRQQGALTLENLPEIPAELLESQRRYQNARSANFQDWLADGSMLITTRFGNTYQLHRVAGPGMARTQLTFGEEPVSSVEAIPGTNRFLYARDVGGAEYYQAYVRGLAGPEWQVTAPNTRNESFVFSSDGKMAAWAQVNRGDPNYDIVVMNTADPRSRRVVHEGVGAIAPLDVSPDGRTLLLGRYSSIAESERYLLDIASGRLTELNPTAGKIAYGGGQFTPDGRAVIMTSDQGRDTLRLVRFDVATGAQTPISPDAPWDVEAFDVSKDGGTLAYAINEEGFSRVYLQDLRTRRRLQQPELPKGVLTGLDFSPDGRKLAISLSTPLATGDVWAWDLQAARLERWTESELGGMDPSQLVDAELIRYRSFDGRSIPAFVYKPKTPATGKRPVVIQIHGGPESQERPAFNPRRQSWVHDLGAVVITPNVRGSEGYGKAYLALDNAEKREDSVKDIGALLDWIATQPDLDASRVAVVGQSYGGYMVLGTMAHYAPRPGGGINLYGISDFATFLRNTEAIAATCAGRSTATSATRPCRPSSAASRRLNMSLRMTKPMMVYQGANDPRVPKERVRPAGPAPAQPGHRGLVRGRRRRRPRSLPRKANAEVVRAAETPVPESRAERAAQPAQAGGPPARR